MVGGFSTSPRTRRHVSNEVRGGGLIGSSPSEHRRSQRRVGLMMEGLSALIVCRVG